MEQNIPIVDGLIVRDSEGRPRIELGVRGGDEVVEGPYIEMIDRKGTPRLRITLSDDTQDPVIEMTDRKGKIQLSIEVTGKDAPLITMRGADGEPVHITPRKKQAGPPV